MHSRNWKIEVNPNIQLKTTGGTPLTVQKICATPHIRQEKQILKAGVSFEGSNRAGEGSEEDINNKNSNTISIINNHTVERTIELQTHTGGNTSQENPSLILR